MIRQGAFMEHAKFAGNYYGTQKKHLEELLKQHPIVFTQIDVNGKHQLDRLSLNHVSIFLVPDSLETLRTRITARGGLTPEAVEERMKIAREEIAGAADYEYQITNENGKMAETVAKIAKIIEEKTGLQPGIDKKALFS
jgi:guanylate kinase